MQFVYRPLLLINFCTPVSGSVLDGFYVFVLDAETVECITGMKHNTLQQLQGSSEVKHF